MQNNELEILNKVEIKYNDKNLLSKDDLTKYILNGEPFKIKVASTLDNKSVIVNDEILNKLEISKTTYNDYKKLDYTKSKYTLVTDLLKDTKGSVITYIEIIDNSKKHIKEKEIIESINLNGINAIITSKESKVIKYFKKKAPNIIRGFKYDSLFNDNMNLGYFDKKKIKNIKIPYGTKPNFIEYDINTLNNESINIINKKKLNLITYLIDTDAKYKKAKSISDSYIVKCNYSDREEF